MPLRLRFQSDGHLQRAAIVVGMPGEVSAANNGSDPLLLRASP